VIENIPIELPPDVVRAQEDVDEAPLEIDVRSKFELFENFGKKKDSDASAAPSPVKRTPSVLLDKLHFFEDQKGVPTSELNGELNNSDVENDELQQQSLGIDIDIDQKRKQFSSLDSSQQQLTGLEQRKQEMLKFRSRLCHGKSNLMKELYEKGFHKEEDEEKEVAITSREAASKLKEMFESGTVVHADDEDMQSEPQEEGEDLKQELQKSRTTSKMLSVFRELEKNQNGTTKGPKKLKEFTPPRDGQQRIYPNSDEERSQGEESEENEEEAQNGEEVDSKDAFLKEVGSLARAKSLRAKFEKWSRDEENEEQDEDDGRKDFVDLESIESARILRERFEQGLIQQQERVIKKKQQVVRRFV